MQLNLEKYLYAPLRSVRQFAHREALLLLLIAFTLTVRLLGYEGYHLNGDNTSKWEFLRTVVEGSDDNLRFTHHTTRWGIILPGAIAYLLCGNTPFALLLPSLAIAVLQTAGLYKSGCLLHSRALGVVSAVVLVMLPQWTFSADQFMPSGFSAAYLTWVVYFLLKYWKDPSGGATNVVACALSMFAAYLAKVPCLLVMPGLLVGLWLCHKNFKHVMLLCGILLALFLIETSLYALFVDRLPLGRYSALSVHHLRHKRLVPVEDFWALFKRYAVLKGPWHFLFYAYAMACAVLLLGACFTSTGIVAVALVSLSFYLGLGLAVKSIHPLVPVQPLRDRYFADAAPLMVLVLMTGVFEFARWGSSATRQGALPLGDVEPSEQPTAEMTRGQRLQAWAQRNRLLVASCTLMALLGLYTYQFRYVGDRRHPLTRLGRLQQEVKKAYERGDPILSTDPKHKSLSAVRYVFWPFPIDDAPRVFHRGTLGKGVDFLTKETLESDKARQRYLDGYRGKKVLLLTASNGKLNYRHATLTGAKKSKARRKRGLK